ncbi:MAG: hypothetical protein ACXIUW_01950 [Roseinatronobacter sp.]
MSFTVTQFAKGNLSASQTDYTTLLSSNFVHTFATEDFEGFDTLGQIGIDGTAVLNTNVGTFTTIGGTGNGSTAVGTNNTNSDSDRGRNLSIRQAGDGAPSGGRQNTSFTTAADNTYLDSNDTSGMLWSASAGTNAFDRLLFTITDPSDAGATMKISVAGFDSKTFTIGKQPDGEIFNVLISFSERVSMAEISLANNRVNDGFSIDNVTIGAVPLPAALWLLLGASGALIVAKRRSATKAA